MDKVVALDLGNVCVKVDPSGCLRALGVPSLDAIPAEFLAACEAFETGRLDEPAWLDAFRSATGGAFATERLRDAFCLIIGDEIPGMADFVRGLTASGHRVALLSDTSPLHLYYSLSKLSFAHLLTGGAYSFEAGARKPAAARGWAAHLFTTADGCREAFARVVGDVCA